MASVTAVPARVLVFCACIAAACGHSPAVLLLQRTCHNITRAVVLLFVATCTTAAVASVASVANS
jgi:hypothetical protein